LLQKSFWDGERKFLEPLTRFTRGDLRDHFVSSGSAKQAQIGLIMCATGIITLRQAKFPVIKCSGFQEVFRPRRSFKTLVHVDLMRTAHEWPPCVPHECSLMIW
jgi:hypothetical protein